MSGAVTSIPRCALIACVGTTLPVFLMVRLKPWCIREYISTIFLAKFDYNGPTLWAGLIMNGKSGTGGKGWISGNIPLWIGPSDSKRLPVEILGTLPCRPNAFRKRVSRVINVVNWRKCEWVVNYLKSAVKWSLVEWRGMNRGLPWRVFMVGEVKWSEVKWSEGSVKIGVLYLWSNDIRN